MQILVVGAGAIGGLIGGRLASNPDLSVGLAVRSERPALAITRGDAVTWPPVTYVHDPSEVGAVDWLVVATKVPDLASAAVWIDAACGPSTRVVVAQNGIDHAERLAEWVPATAVVPAIVTHGVARRAPHELVHTMEGKVLVPDSGIGRAFAKIAERTGLGVEPTVEFEVALWTKLARNLVGNSLTTITDLRPDQVGRSAALRPLATALVAECTRAAASRGVTLPEDLAADVLDSLAGHPEDVRSSMWQDRQAGRTLEHNAISGAIVRIAEAQGFDAPCSRSVTALLAAVSDPAGK